MQTKYGRIVTAILLIEIVIVSGTMAAIESHGVTLNVLKEESIDGLLAGKYRMRATEITARAGHVIRELSHGGRGIGYLLNGTEMSTENGRSERYTAGQAITVGVKDDRQYKNAGEDLVRIVVFEVLPLSQTKTRKPSETKDFTEKVRLEREIDVPTGENKIVLVYGKIARGGFAGEHTHRGNEIRMLLTGSLTMSMHQNTEHYERGNYFFEPANTHMMKVEGDKNQDTSFIIFEQGPTHELDDIYHPGE